MELQQTDEGVPQILPGNHRVHKAVLHLKLRPLKALRQGLADGLLNDPRPGEADERAGFGQNNVAQRGETGGDAAGG